MYVLVNPQSSQIEYLFHFDTLDKAEYFLEKWGYNPSKLVIQSYQDFKKTEKWGLLKHDEQTMVSALRWVE